MAKYDVVSYKRPRDSRRTLRRLFGYMKRYRTLLFVVAVLAIINSSASIFGTYSYKTIINQYIMPRDLNGLARAVLKLAILYLAGAAATYGSTRIMVRISQQVVYDIRKDLFTHTQKLPLAYFDKTAYGDLMSRFTNDIDTITEALNNSFTMIIQSSVVLVGTFVMILILNARLSLIVLISQALMLLYVRYSSKKSHRYYAEQQKNLGDMNGFLEEMINGQKVEKVFNHEKENFDKFCTLNDTLRFASTSAATYTGIMMPVVVSITYLNYALSAACGGLFALMGMMDLGSLASYLVFVRQSAMPINQFTQQVNFLLSALSGAERVFDVLDEETEIDAGSVVIQQIEDSHTPQWHDTAKTPLIPDTPLRGDVLFSNVSFAYNSSKTTLHDISLHAAPGAKIAFVGSTGAGKTTIINLINRFYDIKQGEICYDGIPIQMISLTDLRQNIAVIVQNTHLFSGSIADNIRYGRLDASDEEVLAAARLAHADSFIRRLPQGYQTQLHNDGGNLSQGQRQLLAIARAAISRPPVLVLDEATSSIDTRTERLIEKGMDELMLGRTVLVIAHRLSTVRNSDCIMFLEGGKIIEQGNHDQLLRLDGRYASLYNGQFDLD